MNIMIIMKMYQHLEVNIKNLKLFDVKKAFCYPFMTYLNIDL